MHILVSTITGKTLNLSVETVDEIYSQIECSMGIPTSEQKLLFNNKSLSIGDSLVEAGLKEQSSIALVVALEGGAKGKKKKKDTKKNKAKHHKRKVNLQILKYYKVEGDKIIRLKQMCKICPPGTFIAEHEDRLYCGRCHTTYTKVVDKSKAKAPKQKVGTQPKVAEKVAAPAKGKGKKK